MATTINGIDIATYGCTLLTKALPSHEVKNVYDWLDGAPAPVYHRQDQLFRDLQLVLLLEASTVQQAESYFASLMLQLRSCVVKFDDLGKYFAARFDGAVNPERITGRVWKLSITLKCYKTYLPEVTETATGVGSKSVTNTGSIPAECYITVTPVGNIAEFTITGLSASPIKLKNIVAGQPHVLDGYLYRYLRNGANDIANLDAFAWPVLPVGTTSVTFSHSTVTVQIKYYPKFN